MKQLDLLSNPLPPGFEYIHDFITPDEEQFLIQNIRGLSFKAYQHGEYTAHRKVAGFGMEGQIEGNSSSELPAFILPFASRIENHFDLLTGALSAVLFTHYPLGSAIGWHRDNPAYQDVFGLSLLSDCCFEFRHPANYQKDAPILEQQKIELERRSAYAMRGASRAPWQHRIQSMKSERCSVTFRTLKAAPTPSRLQ